MKVNGVRLGTAAAGIKRADREDITLIEVCAGATAAAVFTRNQFCAAPVTLARSHIKQLTPRYLLINSGNANAGTGQPGKEAALATCRAVAAQGGCDLRAVLPFSTGVIGEPLPVAKIEAALPRAFAALNADGWDTAARAIMTTDTVPKRLSTQVPVDGTIVTVTGIAKGAGMIEPNMATMLAFIATDASLSQAAASALLTRAVNRSFNRITVDGDTSTNDACVLIATGKAGAPMLDVDAADTPDYHAIEAAVGNIARELAQAIVRDGEGATKFITIEVRNGATALECHQVARCVANSPLVKTAFFASDPNWGRILAAVGRANVADLDIDRVSIHLDDVCIVQSGGRAPDYTEARGQAVMARKEITVRIDLGRGDADDRVWTCDFSYDYVRINAEYRT
jgi:glutamate N-acetyltransferase/amino-acid N-acetyltransferase